MKRVIALLMACCFILIALVACGKKEEKPTETQATQTLKQTDIYGQDALEATVDWAAMDFGGEEVNVLVREDLKSSREWEKEVIDDDDELELAIEARNEVVESDLNVTVNIIYVPGANNWVGGTDWGGDFMPRVQQDIDNDLHEIDVTANFGYSGMNVAYRDCWANLLDEDTFPHFEFSLPCWNQAIYANGTVNDRLYICAGDLNVSMFDTAMIMWHNKDLYLKVRTDDDPADIQDVAVAGEWTYSELYKWSQYYEDVEPTGNKGDIYGIWMQGCTWPAQPMQVFPFAWDFDFMEQNSDGTYSFTIEGNARMEQALVSIRNLFVQKGVANELTGSANFTTGVILFKGDIIYWDKASNLAIREMKDKYALLPWPKFDETQDHYASSSQDYFTTMSVIDHSRSTKPINGEVISAYLEYATEYSYTHVRGYYFERIIKPKFFGTDDSDGHVSKSIAIFNTVIDNLEYDFATIYSPMLSGVVGKCWTNNIVDRTGKPYSTTVTSVFKANEKTYNEALASLNEWFALEEE